MVKVHYKFIEILCHKFSIWRLTCNPNIIDSCVPILPELITNNMEIIILLETFSDKSINFFYKVHPHI